ncbi:MAG: phosphatase PAP2 family protein [Gammaproteobacteria bacterium]
MQTLLRYLGTLIDVSGRTLGAAARELGLVAAIAIVAGGSWIFVEVSEEVVEGETHALDRALILALRNPADPGDPVGPGWVEELGRDVTALGGVGVLTYVTLAVVVYLVLQRQRRAALYVAAAIALGMLISFALKTGFDRPRPELVPHGSLVYTSSFPSGHSMMAALVYLTLGVLLARLQPRRQLKAYVIGLAVLTALAVGISRVYLGVHWPTDVVAGWVAGAVWAMTCWTVALWLQRRRAVEPTARDHDAAATRRGP